MNKTEQKLMDSYKQRKEFKSKIDCLVVNRFSRQTIDYFSHHHFVYCKRIKDDNTEMIYFCMPTCSNGLSKTIQRRLNLFLQDYGLKIHKQNGLYYCNDKEIRLDIIYFIIKDNKGNYFIH